MVERREINVLTLKLSVSDNKVHVEAFVDGASVAAGSDEEIDIAWGLLPSVDHDGDYFMVTCSCGDAGCAGYMDPTGVAHDGNFIRWTGEHPNCDFTFERGAYATEIRRAIAEGRQHAVAGHSAAIDANKNLFDSESYESLLPNRWDYEQRQRADERLRKELWENDPEEFRRRYRRNPAVSRLRIAFAIVLAVALIPVWIPMLLWLQMREWLRRRR